MQKIATILKGLFTRTTFDFQGPPTRNVISQIEQKCTFSVHSNRTIRLELFPHQLYIFQFTCLKLIVNSCIKQTTLYVNHFDLSSVLENQKALKKTLSRPPHSKLKKIQGLLKDLRRNLKTLQGKMEFKDFSRTLPKIQGLLKTVRTLD